MERQIPDRVQIQEADVTQQETERYLNWSSMPGVVKCLQLL
jgi:hypothetical protein